MRHEADVSFKSDREEPSTFIRSSRVKLRKHCVRELRAPPRYRYVSSHTISPYDVRYVRSLYSFRTVPIPVPSVRTPQKSRNPFIPCLGSPFPSKEIQSILLGTSHWQSNGSEPALSHKSSSVYPEFALSITYP